MSDNKDFIVDDYDFIKPEFITTPTLCYEQIKQAYKATQALEQYRIALVHKIAELTKQKVFRLKTEYDNIQCYNYFVGKNKKELEDEVSGICNEIICFDEDYPSNYIELVKDYSNE